MAKNSCDCPFHSGEAYGIDDAMRLAFQKKRTDYVWAYLSRQLERSFDTWRIYVTEDNSGYKVSSDWLAMSSYTTQFVRSIMDKDRMISWARAQKLKRAFRYPVGDGWNKMEKELFCGGYNGEDKG